MSLIIIIIIIIIIIVRFVELIQSAFKFC